MLIRKGFKFRVYPTPAQEARLVEWENALRFLWNLAHEQRKMGLSCTDKRYPTAFDQMREVTLLRKELPWLKAVPCDVCAQVLLDLDAAWSRRFARIAGEPKWKKKGRDFISITERHAKAWKLTGSSIRFPKIGSLRAVVHRKLEGKPKRCTIRRDGDQWFASIICEIDAADPERRTEPVLALDRGITHFLADSNGGLTPNPRFYERSMARLARAQRTVSRRKKGSKNREKAKLRVMRIHRKVRRQREHFLHVEARKLADSQGVVVLEKLNVANMIKGRLSRQIADVGWSKFADMLRYKLAWSGGSLVEVPAHYSSQTCSECGRVDSKSRNGGRFCCTGCGFCDHADLNAAKVLKQRYEAPGNPWCQPVEASAIASLRSGKATRRKVYV